jgi:WD40 repeat protein
MAQLLDTALRLRGLDPWIDVARVQPGDEWQDVIAQGIVECTSMIVLCTPDPSSELQQQEWEEARRLEKRIVPVLLEGATLPEPLAGLYPIISSGDMQGLADTLYELSGAAITLERPPPGLLDAMTKGELVIFIGAGLAAEADYPQWPEFVTGLLDWAERQGQLAPSMVRSLQSSLRVGDYNSVADAVAGAVDRADLAALVCETFSRTLLASGSYDGSIRLWDSATGTAVRKPLTGHTGPVTALAPVPIPDGRTLLASCSYDGSIRLWDPATGTAVGKPLTGHTGRIYALTLVPFPDGRTLLASGGGDGSIRLWDPATGTAVGKPLTGRTGRIYALTLVPFPDGRTLLASGGGDGSIRLWNPATGTAVGKPLTGHTGSVGALTPVPGHGGRTLLASGGSDGSIRLWDPATGTAVGNPLTGHTGSVGALTPVPGHGVRTLLASGAGGSIRLWDPATGTAVGKPLTARARGVYSLVPLRDSDDRKPPDAYRTLGRLGVSAIVTTNYDRLVDKAWPRLPRLTWRDSGDVLDFLSLGEPFTLHIYGHPDDPQSLLFSPAQLEELMRTNLEVASALEAVFSSRTILFVGASLNGILDFIKPLPIRSLLGSVHYAVVHADSPGWQAHADQLRRRFNIHVLPYTGAAHEQVSTFLAQLGDNSGRRARVAVPGRAEKLIRVSLENIGPYENLTLDLDPCWNVLLGDNGVGKSSILKAIALVYSADDGSAYADRLLRVGASRGAIRIETDAGRSFHTELLRSTTGVQVRHTPGIKLEAEGQLVIGFPPLRSLSWRREPGLSVAETFRRPSPSDLIPLLGGDPDSRLDSVKQRFINCDYLIKDAQAKGKDASAYRRLQNDLARAMEVLTDGLAVRFGGVDARNNVVFVKTADGRLPIEALSQGTGALIGWVSFIIQRLHDTAAEGEVPLKRNAIVLVDELDAHLHPDWQQQLTSRLGALFPRVQFLGTTHSPLIAGGMAQRQVTVLRRQGGLVVKVPLPGDPGEVIRGRADQLLTGRLFGLATSVDIETRRAVERYNALLGADRTPQEDTEYHELQELLEVRVPVGATTPAEQRAQDFLHLLLLESAGSDEPAARERLLEKARLLLDEAARMRPVGD